MKTASPWRRFLYGSACAIAAKIMLEIFLTSYPHAYFPTCTMFVQTDDCSLMGWIFNPGDVIVMLPAFLLGVWIANVQETWPPPPA